LWVGTDVVTESATGRFWYFYRGLELEKMRKPRKIMLLCPFEARLEGNSARFSKTIGLPSLSTS